MAWGNTSKVFAYAQLVMATKEMNVSNTNTPDTVHAALFLGTNTPDNTVTTALLSSYNGTGSQWVSATYEASGTNYSAGGQSIGTNSLTQATNVITFTSTTGTLAWSNVTVTNVYGALVYDYSISTGSGMYQGICFNSFGGSGQSVAGGTFTITWNSLGIANWSC